MNLEFVPNAKTEKWLKARWFLSLVTLVSFGVKKSSSDYPRIFYNVTYSPWGSEAEVWLYCLIVENRRKAGAKSDYI